MKFKIEWALLSCNTNKTVTTLQNKTIFLKIFANIKITVNIKTKFTSSLTLYLAFRIFDIKRHHLISGALKNMFFGKGRRCCRKKLQKVK